MYAIFSLLSPQIEQSVRSIWKELETECGLSGIRMTPIPHFSWQVAEHYDIPMIENVLGLIGARTEPFVVHTTGLGVFTGPQPVVYAAMVKDSGLVNMHQMIWEATFPYAQNLSPFYEVDDWMPHITLTYRDVETEKLGCALERLAYRPMDWEIEVRQLVLGEQVENRVGEIIATFNLGEQSPRVRQSQ